jgi:hypothetical protein
MLICRKKEQDAKQESILPSIALHLEPFDRPAKRGYQYSQSFAHP